MIIILMVYLCFLLYDIVMRSSVVHPYFHDHRLQKAYNGLTVNLPRISFLVSRNASICITHDSKHSLDVWLSCAMGGDGDARGCRSPLEHVVVVFLSVTGFQVNTLVRLGLGNSDD